MQQSFNRFDPMHQSMYLESLLPTNISDEILTTPTTNYPPLGADTIKPNSPKLAPQPAKDGFYKNDGADDGKISFKEKAKAFLKGGTYNMVRGLFCDKDGFSIKRTLLTIGLGAAILSTGPVGAAIAGGVGLIAAATNFVKSAINAKNATTDQQSREAYEGFGESTTTALLSAFGGFKGFKAIKNNFSHGTKGNFFKKLTNWKTPQNPTTPPPEENVVQKGPSGASGITDLPATRNKQTYKLGPIEDYLPKKEQDFPEINPKYLSPQETKLLESPEVVRARQEATGQIQLPIKATPDSPQIKLNPIEDYLPKQE